MTFSGAVFITAVAAIRATAIHHLPKKTFLILWDIALLKLLLPFTVPSIFSIHTLIDRILSASSWTETETHSTAFVLSQKTFVILQGIEQPDNPCFSIWFMVWCTGMILAAAFFVTSYLHCRTEFQAAFPVSNAYTKQWLKDHPCKRRISIRQSDRISAPLTYGIFHPVILMPKKNGLGESRAIMVYFRTRICAYPSFGCLYQTGRRTCPLCPLVQPFCLGHVSSFQSRYGTGMWWECHTALWRNSKICLLPNADRDGSRKKQASIIFQPFQ